jgi:hypothetical protein
MGKLTPAQHVEVGRLLKCARRDLHDAAVMCRRYGRLSRELFEVADAIPTGWLETRLVELVGADGVIDGKSVRDVYRGEEADG